MDGQFEIAKSVNDAGGVFPAVVGDARVEALARIVVISHADLVAVDTAIAAGCVPPMGSTR